MLSLQSMSYTPGASLSHFEAGLELACWRIQVSKALPEIVLVGGVYVLASAGTATLETGAERWEPSIGMPGSLTLLVVTTPCVPGEELPDELADEALMLAVLPAEELLPDAEALGARAAFWSAPACAILDVGMAECAVASAYTVTHSISQFSSRSSIGQAAAAAQRRAKEKRVFIFSDAWDEYLQRKL